jgi:hypothetical protein
MQALGALLTILKSLPAIIALLTELSAWLKDTFGDEPEKFLVDSSEAFKKAREAKTMQEKRDAAVKISQLLRRL